MVDFIKRFLTFRRMISPGLLQILYWLSLLGWLWFGIATLFADEGSFYYLEGGPVLHIFTFVVLLLITRVVFEYAIIFFSTHREVAGARHILKQIAVEGYSIKIVDDGEGCDGDMERRDDA